MSDRRTAGTGTDRAGDRAQSHVVGVALLLGITAVSLAALTTTVGTVVEANAAGVDAGRVAADLASGLPAATVTGPHAGHVSFTDGRLRTVERTVRVVNDTGEVQAIEVGGLVWTDGGHRVTYLGGAVVRGPPGNARLHARPPLATSAGTLAVGVAVLGPERVDYSGGGRVELDTVVAHERTSYPTGSWRLAVETETPGAWEAFFATRGAATSRHDFDGDGVASVVASFPGERRLHLVVHRLNLGVRFG